MDLRGVPFSLALTGLALLTTGAVLLLLRKRRPVAGSEV
jgi:hypothetical protein